jgi:hypothetical protein
MAAAQSQPSYSDLHGSCKRFIVLDLTLPTLPLGD